MKQILIYISLLIAFTANCRVTQDFDLLDGEKWWGAATNLGTKMPFMVDGRQYDLRSKNYSNQTAPLLLSNKGRYIWSETPFRFSYDNTTLHIETEDGMPELKQAAENNLRSAYLAASAEHFPPQGGTPPKEFFEAPVYNTWIELMYEQNQADILKYANDILAHGFPPGILMIDDNWQQDYGVWDFHPGRFPAPEAMVDSLHAMGFKVMLWVCPFVSADSKEARDLHAKSYLIKTPGGKDMAPIAWWNGYSACFDLSNPDANAYLCDQFNRLEREYGIDGFKFDAGDTGYYIPGNVEVYDGKSYGPEQTQLWAELAEKFPYNELRACWKSGNRPLVQRLCDKGYSWAGVKSLVPSMLAAALIGHSYSCPDMVGGGEYTSFLDIDADSFNAALLLRSCQIHAMMPIMQFSVAPWRVLDSENLEICRSYALLHRELGPYIVEMAKKTATTGEPIVRHMAYSFPDEGFEEISDQYMLGDRYLVAPVTDASDIRTVKLPQGRWRDENGKTYRGGRTISIEAPLSRLPRFEKL